MEAYVRGLERFVEGGGDPAKVRSVASFFVSRVDTETDKRLEAIGSEEALALRGKLAIANARIAYQHYKRVFSGERWEALEAKGALPQRCLWASTSTKNPDYRDVLYVEELIGPHTVNTMPEETIQAFQDHGEVRGDTVENDLEEARALLQEKLPAVGVDYDDVVRDAREGGRAEVLRLLRRAARRREGEARGRGRVAGERRRADRGDLGARRHRLDRQRRGALARLARRAAARPGAARRASAASPSRCTTRSTTSSSAAWAARRSRRRCCGARSASTGSTSSTRRIRRAIRALEEKLDLERTFFVSSSKSGTTLETRSHTEYFWEKTGKRAEMFAAITDPGSELEHLARERGFRAVFAGEPSIGGRYSALSPFGIVPAVLMGADASRLLERAQEMREACRSGEGNPGYELGRQFGEGWHLGRDKICIADTPGGFGLWAEQLIAESTGKHGKGLVPAPGESPDGADRQAADPVPPRPVCARGASSSAGSSRSPSPARISRSTRSTSRTCRRRRTRRTRCSRPGKEPEARAGGLGRGAARPGAGGRLRLRAGVRRPGDRPRSARRAAPARERPASSRTATARATSTRPASSTRAARTPASSSR